MGTWLRRKVLLIGGLVALPFVMVLSFDSAAYGHGNYVAARLLLPSSCLGMGNYAGAALVVVVLALLQWPVYGFLIDQARHRAAVLIASIHIAICIWLFTKGAGNSQ